MNRTLEKGLLLEFKKDSERVLLAIAQKPDGKKIDGVRSGSSKNNYRTILNRLLG